MKMVSMERTEKEKKAEREKYSPSIGEDSGPDYPYGTRIRLEKAEIDKLGWKDLPAVGEEMTVIAKVCVTMVEENYSKTNERCTVELQITEMGIEAGEKKEKKPLTEAPMEEYASRRKKGEKP